MSSITISDGKASVSSLTPSPNAPHVEKMMDLSALEAYAEHEIDMVSKGSTFVDGAEISVADIVESDASSDTEDSVSERD
jgi:hypothetical protein